MLRQGINQLFLFGVYDHLKMAVYGLERDAAISSHQALILVSYVVTPCSLILLGYHSRCSWPSCK